MSAFSFHLPRPSHYSFDEVLFCLVSVRIGLRDCSVVLKQELLLHVSLSNSILDLSSLVVNVFSLFGIPVQLPPQSLSQRHLTLFFQYDSSESHANPITPSPRFQIASISCLTTHSSQLKRNPLHQLLLLMVSVVYESCQHKFY